MVGDDTLIANDSELFGASSGNVFGIGNGNAQSTQVGSADILISLLMEMLR